MKQYVIYWTSTGNTQVMAETIAESIQGELASVDQATVDTLKAADVVYLGAPAMGVEEVDDEMMDFIKEQADVFATKKVVLFGSYDWGDGDWLTNWENEMTSIGATVVGTLKVQNTPDEEGIEACKALAKSLSES